MNVMGCIDQDQICNLSKGLCTPIGGSSQLVREIDQIGLNEVQKKIAERMSTAAASERYHALIGRDTAALRANEVVTGRLSGSLERDQWMIEASSWFNIGLAKLQQRMVENAAGPSTRYDGYRIEHRNDTIGKAMCYSQKLRSTENSVSSVLGVSIILGVGSIIIFTNLVLDTVVGFIQHRYLRRGEHRRRQWILDETLQLQRLALQGVRMGSWSGVSSAIPVTKLGELLNSLEFAESQEPLLSPTLEMYPGFGKDMATGSCDTFGRTFNDVRV